MRARLFAPELRKWWTLFAVAFGLFMIMLDNTVVNVALPSIREDLGISISELEWVVNGYALTFGVLLLSGGKLADMLGRRRIFIVGLVIFTASSFFCGFASSAAVLIGARVVQGVGAALMNPATLSIITATFPPRQRGTAIGIWAGVSAMALAFGPLVGGAITEHINWSWVFYINVPIGILGIVAARLFIDESRDTSEQRLDPLGLVTSAIALFALTYGLIESNSRGWGDPLVLGCLVVAAVFFVVFVAAGAAPAPADARPEPLPQQVVLERERRDAADRARDVRDVLLRLALRPERSGLLADPGGCDVPADDAVHHLRRAGRGEARGQDRAARADGAGAGARDGVARPLLAPGRGSTFWTLLPALLVGGLGMALAMAPTTTAAMHAVPIDKAGVGSAVINSMRQVGGSIGIALTGAIVATQVNPARPNPHDFVNGFQLGLRVAAGIAFTGVLIAAFGIKPEQLRHDVAEPKAAAEAA